MLLINIRLCQSVKARMSASIVADNQNATQERQFRFISLDN